MWTAEYSGSIDMWSVGCIFAEMLGRKPAFPGKDYIHQLKLILEACALPRVVHPPHALSAPSPAHALQVLGTQAEPALHFISSPKARAWIQSLPSKPKASLPDLFPSACAQALDLLDRMLVFDPHERISVEDALAHPYLASLHDPALEPAAPAPFAADEKEQHANEEQLRQMVFDECVEMAKADEPNNC